MHLPVLLQEMVTALQPRPGGCYLDGTVGAGGHAEAILQASAPDGRLWGLDQDPAALALAEERLAPFGDRVVVVSANFDRLSWLARQYQWPLMDGILLDLGVSSMQFDQPERGFSFQAEAPLDMRMNPTTGQTAAEMVNTLPETELADLIYQYGEERQSRRIARAIVHARPINTTTELAQVITQAKRRSRSKIHPATQTFQALRIAVNDELGALTRVLPQAVAQLKPGGRVAVISFHSLEDRIVKWFFKQEATDCLCPVEQLICSCDHQATINIITKKPITSSPQQIAANPRSRSAKLRVAELSKDQ